MKKEDVVFLLVSIFTLLIIIGLVLQGCSTSHSFKQYTDLKVDSTFKSVSSSYQNNLSAIASMLYTDSSITLIQRVYMNVFDSAGNYVASPLTTETVIKKNKINLSSDSKTDNLKTQNSNQTDLQLDKAVISNTIDDKHNKPPSSTFFFFLIITLLLVIIVFVCYRVWSKNRS